MQLALTGECLHGRHKCTYPIHIRFIYRPETDLRISKSMCFFPAYRFVGHITTVMILIPAVTTTLQSHSTTKALPGCTAQIQFSLYSISLELCGLMQYTLHYLLNISIFLAFWLLYISQHLKGCFFY